MTLYARKYQLLAGLEDTKGTAQSLTGSDGVFNVFDLSCTYNIPKVQREQQGTMNLLQHSYGPMSATLRFRSEVVGSGSSGSVPAWATVFLQGCGWLNSAGTFTRSESFADQETITMKYFMDGHVRTLIGCAGTFSLVYNYGKIHDINWEFTGKVAPEADAAIPSVTEPTVIPPRGLATCTMNSTDIEFGQFTINSGGQVQLLEEPKNDTNLTGYSHACIPNYITTGTLDPRATVVATKNWWTEFTGLQERAVSLIAGSAANNTVTLAATKFQCEVPQFAARGGVATRALTGVFNSGFTLAFT